MVKGVGIIYLSLSLSLSLSLLLCGSPKTEQACRNSDHPVRSESLQLPNWQILDPPQIGPTPRCVLGIVNLL